MPFRKSLSTAMGINVRLFQALSINEAHRTIVNRDQSLPKTAGAARVGFDWPDIQGVWEKLNEELKEVDSAGDGESRAAEIGDLLFAAVNLARWYKVDPESALRAANARFRGRFHYIERAARASGRSIADLTLDEMEALWQQAKRRD